MVRITEAIFANGVLRPMENLNLREEERVRLIVEPIDGGADGDRLAALERVLKGQAQMHFRSNGPYPTREELHERG